MPAAALVEVQVALELTMVLAVRVPEATMQVREVRQAREPELAQEEPQRKAPCAATQEPVPVTAHVTPPPGPANAILCSLAMIAVSSTAQVGNLAKMSVPGMESAPLGLAVVLRAGAWLTAKNRRTSAQTRFA